MKELVKKYWLTIVGVIVGMIGGYLYYKFIGCTNGTCAITSNPTNSAIYGAIMGGLLLNVFQKEKINNLK